MNCSGSFGWVIFNIGLYYIIIGCAECSFLWCLLPRTISTMNLFHTTFSKLRLCIPKSRKQATRAKGLLVFQHTALFLPTFLLSCLLNSRSAPTSWYRSLFTSQVTGYEVSIPVVQSLPCCRWDTMCFSDGKQHYCCFTPARHMARGGATERRVDEQMMSHCH